MQDKGITIERLLDEIAYFQQAEDLLEKVYLEVGAYNCGKVTDETLQKINKHFGFDDSE